MVGISFVFLAPGFENCLAVSFLGVVIAPIDAQSPLKAKRLKAASLGSSTKSKLP